MIETRLTPYAALLLRLALGVVFLAHSIVLKLLTFGLPGTVRFFESEHLPGWLAYVTFAAEAIGGGALVIGVQSRLAALAVAPFMLGALFTVHLRNGWLFEAPGGGWEYPALLSVLTLVHAALGEGAFALWRTRRLGSDHTVPTTRRPALS